MAKPRKPKSETCNPSSSRAATARRQKICLSIDTEKRQIYGYTELEIAVPDIGIVGLHAENIGIDNVFADGEIAEFEYYPRQKNSESEKRWDSLATPALAADAAGSVYFSMLEKEMMPNLLINCCKGFKVFDAQANPQNSDDGMQPSTETKQNIKSIRICYWVEKTDTGIYFSDNVLYTYNQVKRARCWFPCVDDGFQHFCYDMEFTVAHDLVVVSSGNLMFQVLSNDAPPRKTYVYRLDVPVNAQWISLAIARFEIYPDPRLSAITHLCFLDDLSKLRNTTEFFHNVFIHYEEYLDAKFPFRSYTQVFLAPEMVVSSGLAASMSIFSSHILYDEKIIDQGIETSIKLAYSLARQWFGIFIMADGSNDEWLLDGLAGFLTDLFIKRFLGNNEALYRRYKASYFVCKADVSGATALSSSASVKDLFGTHSIGIYRKIRSWKSVSVLQMLEKQMGPESFRRILQKIISRACDANPVRTLSSKEFRHLVTKLGNLERPFVKDFFMRWVCSCGCPFLRMGFSFNKRKNAMELAVIRECTAIPEPNALIANPDSDNHDGDNGFPGMMSIRVYELDGMFDHPVLPLAGDTWQLLEIHCHSKFAAKRLQKAKRASKFEGSDETDSTPAMDIRASVDSPLLWIRADPEMEYLAEIHLNQPLQMWINQLEKDGDVIAQAQAVAALEAIPQPTFLVVNALNNFLCDSKVYWRVRVDAAFALAKASSEDTDCSGLLHLMKFYKSQRPNDFRDFPQHFVLQSIPLAVAMVRTAEMKSPGEAVEFILQLLKYNDNNGNPYSDVFWLASLVRSAGALEFGKQNVIFLPSLLKRIDRILQFEHLMLSHNGILTVSCIHALAQIAIQLRGSINTDDVVKLIKPFRDSEKSWPVRIEASRALLDLEFHLAGIDSALLMFTGYLEEEPSLRGQVKLATRMLHLCQMWDRSDSNHSIQNATLVQMLSLFQGDAAFNNIFLRHHLFCIFQLLAGRPPTLYGFPRHEAGPVDNVTASEPKDNIPADVSNPEMEKLADAPIIQHGEEAAIPTETDKQNVDLMAAADTASAGLEHGTSLVKIRVKRSSLSSRADEGANRTAVGSREGNHKADHLGSSSASVDAPRRISAEAISTSNQNLEEVNSCFDHGSRVTASVGSAKLVGDGRLLVKELQCTADSSFIQDSMADAGAHKYASLQVLSVPKMAASPVREKKEKKRRKRKKGKGRKQKHEDPEYLKRKRLKKEKKLKEKEKPVESADALLNSNQSQPPGVTQPVTTTVKTRNEPAPASREPKLRFRLKSTTLNIL